MRAFWIFMIGGGALAVSGYSLAAGPATVEEIRAEYAAVAAEKLTAFEIPFEYEEVSGTVTHRFNGGEIRSVVAESGAEHGWEIISSYYKDGEPFFVLVELGHWRIVSEEKSWDTVTESRYYLVEGKVIRALEKKFEGGSEAQLKAAALKAENRPKAVTEEEAATLLRKVRLIVAARNASQVAKILFP